MQFRDFINIKFFLDYKKKIVLPVPAAMQSARETADHTAK